MIMNYQDKKNQKKTILQRWKQTVLREGKKISSSVLQFFTSHNKIRIFIDTKKIQYIMETNTMVY